MMDDLVSVIIPVYNSGKFLNKCLDSVISQTYKNLEIIIINDGSTDDSKKIIGSYVKRDKRIKFINQENKGVSVSRNIGIENSMGKYITFIDSDDCYKKDAIETLVSIANNENYDVVRGNYELIKDNKVIERGLINDSEIDNYEEFINKLFNNEIPSYSVLLLIRKEIIEKYQVKFIENICMMEDTLFYVTLFNNHPKAYLSSKVIYSYLYNYNGASKSSEYYVRNLFNVLDVNFYIRKVLSNQKYNESRLNSEHFSIITNYLYSIYIQDKKEFNTILKKIVGNDKYKYIEENSNYSKCKYIMVGEFLIRKKLFNLFKIYSKVRNIMSKQRRER